jgi:hypothetical protein
LGCQVRSEDIHKAYQLPASPPVPIDAQYLERYSQQVPVSALIATSSWHSATLTVTASVSNVEL